MGPDFDRFSPQALGYTLEQYYSMVNDWKMTEGRGGDEIRGGGDRPLSSACAHRRVSPSTRFQFCWRQNRKLFPDLLAGKKGIETTIETPPCLSLGEQSFLERMQKIEEARVGKTLFLHHNARSRSIPCFALSRQSVFGHGGGHRKGWTGDRGQGARGTGRGPGGGGLPRVRPIRTPTKNFQTLGGRFHLKDL